jgi:flagellar hook-length control protein FliK
VFPAPAGGAAGGDVGVGVPNIAVAPTTPTAAAAPAGQAAPAAPALPTPPAAQLAMRIVPLRLDADGVHRLTVNLHPADLGPVQVVAEIRNGEISVQLSGATDAGHDALRDALADLRRDLQAAGFTNCTLDLRQGNPQQDQARQGLPNDNRDGGAPGTPGGSRPAAGEPALIRPARTTSPGRLDIEA